MKETILNIYVEIENKDVVGFKAISYEVEGSDADKINFLKRQAKSDYMRAVRFEAPVNEKGEFISYRKFSRLESKGYHYKLYEEIFDYFETPDNPLICVTPVLDGKILAD
ncbi:hypothetical protein MROS_0177 [Melioribacter roseus P3M-2]|uniref:Uncharacterized protein n=1 Tax=Melioribacter roseus (strain DSM 23840 / JCM 17771 / VKM B-2668 / P3M-2) TaxID=1191523 RepID=I7A0F1_MELRP|nr:hypothetical protein [Melioribacter roseus]AFN73421.1 hypothetical protein MROS_0177 [Melioribacter roseus P3M-2]